MKYLLNPLKFLGALAVLALAVGCASTQTTEDMLSAAGFKTQIATSADQKAHLAALPAGTVTPVERDGVTYFVFPDKDRGLIYIGKQQQYQAYQDYRLKSRSDQQELVTAEMNEQTAAWDAWGGWGAWGW